MNNYNENYALTNSVNGGTISNYDVNKKANAIINAAKKNKCTPATIAIANIANAYGKELSAQIERAGVYYAIKKNKAILSSFGYETFTEFCTKCDEIVDGKSTISQWTTVFEIFVDTNHKINAYSSKLMLTEMIRLLSIANVCKPRLKDDDLRAEIYNFLTNEFPVDGEKSWNSVMELREKIDIYVNGIPEAESAPETSPETSPETPPETSPEIPENVKYTEYNFDGYSWDALNNFIPDIRGKKFKCVITVYEE